MTLKPLPYSQLQDREQRAVARLAAMARRDTIDGGSGALVLAKRADRLGFKSCCMSALAVVSIVYSNSTGCHHRELEAWECQECGQAHLGQDDAYACCAIRELCEETV
jgi:hypothetical protein